MAAFERVWFDEYLHGGIPRDQISLPYAEWAGGARRCDMPDGHHGAKYFERRRPGPQHSKVRAYVAPKAGAGDAGHAADARAAERERLRLEARARRRAEHKLRVEAKRKRGGGQAKAKRGDGGAGRHPHKHKQHAGG